MLSFYIQVVGLTLHRGPLISCRIARDTICITHGITCMYIYREEPKGGLSKAGLRIRHYFLQMHLGSS